MQRARCFLIRHLSIVPSITQTLASLLSPVVSIDWSACGYWSLKAALLVYASCFIDSYQLFILLLHMYVGNVALYFGFSEKMLRNKDAVTCALLYYYCLRMNVFCRLRLPPMIDCTRGSANAALQALKQF